MNNIEFDMCVDSEELNQIKGKLRKLRIDIHQNIFEMLNVLNESDGYLEGRQYEKAKANTLNSIAFTQRAIDNIINAVEYLDELESVLQDYYKYSYSGVPHENK